MCVLHILMCVLHIFRSSQQKSQITDSAAGENFNNGDGCSDSSKSDESYNPSPDHYNNTHKDNKYSGFSTQRARDILMLRNFSSAGSTNEIPQTINNKQQQQQGWIDLQEQEVEHNDNNYNYNDDNEFDNQYHNNELIKKIVT